MQETILTNEMDNPQFSIDEYMKKLNEILNQKQLSLNNMNERFSKLNNLLKNEKNVNEKIKKIENEKRKLNEHTLINQDIELDEFDC